MSELILATGLSLLALGAGAQSAFPSVTLLDTHQLADTTAEHLLQHIALQFSTGERLFAGKYPPGGAKPLVVVNDNTRKWPLTPRLSSSVAIYAIYLTSPGERYWAQYAYQFGHELTHVLYGGNDRTGGSSRGEATLVEEALAELGSYLAEAAASEFFAAVDPGYAQAPQLYIEESDAFHRVTLAQTYPSGTSLAAVARALEGELDGSTSNRALNWRISLAFRELVTEGWSMADFAAVRGLTVAELLDTPLAGFPEVDQALVMSTREKLTAIYLPVDPEAH